MKSRFVVVLSILLLISQFAWSGTTINFQFERYWPVLPQPWYFHDQAGFDIDANGFVYVADWLNGQVKKFSIDGQFIKSTKHDGINPVYVAINPDELVYIIDSQQRILIFTTDLEFLGELGTQGTGPDQFEEATAMEFDAVGNAFVLDRAGKKVLRYASDGQFISSWPYAGIDTEGRDSKFSVHDGMTIDSNGFVYLPDTLLDQVVKLDQNGTEVMRFGQSGTDPGQFDLPLGMEATGNALYVADSFNNRIQKFDLLGNFVREFVDAGDGIGDMLFTDDVVVPENGDVWINNRHIATIHRFSATGTRLFTIRAGGHKPGFFREPTGLAFDRTGRVLIADSFNSRLQIFDPSGQFLFEITGLGDLRDIAVANDNSIVASVGADIFRFDSGGLFINQFPASLSIQPDTAQGGQGVAVDSAGNIYYVDKDSSKIRKFQPDGVLLLEFGSSGTADGLLFTPSDVAVDSGGNIYVVENTDFREPQSVDRIQKFDPSGNFLLRFEDSFGGQNDKIFIDGSRLYVSALYARGIGVFNLDGQFEETILSFGSGPGQIAGASGIGIGPAGQLGVVDRRNNRTLLYRPVAVASNAKAIVVAAGGPFPGNALWDATQNNANFAYRTLLYQGFNKQTITYLSANTSLDLDENGMADDVDADASVAALREAILGPIGDGLTGFAADAEELVIYMVDHGGLDTFRISATETLAASQLSFFVDTWQAAHPTAKVTIIYDACQSGSFVDDLAGGAFERVVIASAMEAENAYFVSQGSLSFSTHFWTHIFNGESVKDAYDLASVSINQAFPEQNPVLDANGDGLSEPVDLTVLADRNLFIGNGTNNFASRPTIDTVTTTPPVQSTATLNANGVTDADGINRVWAVMRIPGFSPGSPDNPVQELPTVDLIPVAGTDNYTAEFDNFTQPGTYQIAIYARDFLGNTAVPELTSVVVDNPLKRRAVVIAGGNINDADFAAYQRVSQFAFNALDGQGYGPDGASCDDSICDDIQYLINEGVASADGTAIAANIQPAIEMWGTDQVKDLTVFLVGRMNGGELRLDSGVTLAASDLVSWLNTAQSIIPGTLTVIIEADDAGSYLAQLNPGMSAQRILIASSGAGQEAKFFSSGIISFSKFFWNQVLNGATTRQAFKVASSAITFGNAAQVPQLDDNANAVPNEILDGLVARTYTLGSGFLLAGDDPLISTLSVSASLASDFETITASDVTTTRSIDQVLAVVSQPGGNTVVQPLTKQGASFSGRSYGPCAGTGDYEVAVYAIDDEGNTSLPVMQTVNRALPCDDFMFNAGFE